ncbi:heme exporter protein A [Halopseudomonas sabulinigri]|uniref:Heme exporter protein A n=1 Tax=Halopseudomonas sabulinigri TaxID=472181 RepID=A0A1H1PMC9_9GAMM|nr:cytochrome c biogenesis heme-transporting ATPase CcmA [Halopseudomonas sabulinigri]SDS12254.1 heme exporter protein A [Halopseudomonas sabulinigri]
MSKQQIDISELACERDERELFSAVSCCLQPGDVLQVAGPNGAGKTSLLRILAGLMPASGGDIRFAGESVLSRRGREHWRRNLLYIGHAPAVKGALSAEENLSWLCALTQPVTREAIWQALQQVGLRGFEDVPCRQLSAGQQRRVALARLYLPGAPVWILDEPFTALDQAGVQALEQHVMAFAAGGGTVVLTTHHSLAHVPGVRRLELGRAS